MHAFRRLLEAVQQFPAIFAASSSDHTGDADKSYPSPNKNHLPPCVELATKDAEAFTYKQDTLISQKCLREQNRVARVFCSCN
jgi:hypothetical protein